VSQRLTVTRGLTEGGVIVASVLLALAADAWWDRRQAAELEAQVVAAVAAELRENQAELLFNVQFIEALLDRSDRFLRSTPSELTAVPADSVLPFVEGLSRPQTFDPRTAAASILSQTAVLSADGIQGRALVSEFFTRVSDASEEKDGFRSSSRAVQEHLSSYATRAGVDGIGTVSEVTARLGPTLLGELRADDELVRLVILRAAVGQIYVRSLRGLSELLETLAASLPSMSEPGAL
jgi:hypothetical protein